MSGHAPRRGGVEAGQDRGGQIPQGHQAPAVGCRRSQLTVGDARPGDDDRSQPPLPSRRGDGDDHERGVRGEGPGQCAHQPVRPGQRVTALGQDLGGRGRCRGLGLAVEVAGVDRDHLGPLQGNEGPGDDLPPVRGHAAGRGRVGPHQPGAVQRSPVDEARGVGHGQRRRPGRPARVQVGPAHDRGAGTGPVEGVAQRADGRGQVTARGLGGHLGEADDGDAPIHGATPERCQARPRRRALEQRGGVEGQPARGSGGHPSPRAQAGVGLDRAGPAGHRAHVHGRHRPLSGQVSVRQKWSSAGKSACAAPVVTSPSGKPVGTSMHGWGKAADFSDVTGTMTFDSPGYRFLLAQAARFGWNHPAWARPGGSVCPEAWHWEWVGDGGIQHASSIPADVVTLLPTSDGLGYSIVTGLGGVRPHGDATDHGTRTDPTLAWLVVGAARTPDGGGYWFVCGDGSVRAFGDARSFGPTSPPPFQPVVGIAPSADGAGYWLATADGHVFSFGAARSYGSPASSGASLARPIVAIVATADGRGYWLAGADGKVFAYGDAATYLRAAGRPLPAPVVSMAATSDGRGYWLVNANGTVHTFGDARSFGSIPRRIALRQPVTVIAPTGDSGGYWLVAADGSIFAFGNAALYGPAHRARMVAGQRWLR